MISKINLQTSFLRVLHLMKRELHPRLLLQRRQRLLQLVLYLLTIPFLLFLHKRNFLHWLLSFRRYPKLILRVHLRFPLFPWRWRLNKVFRTLQCVKFECPCDFLFLFNFDGKNLIKHSLEPVLKEVGHVNIDNSNLDIGVGSFFKDSNFAIFTKSRNPKDKDLVFPVGEDFLSFCRCLGLQNLFPNLNSDVDFAFAEVFIPFIYHKSIDHLEG